MNTKPELGMNPKDALGTRKVPLSLVPPASLIYQALAMKDGARKYQAYNWRDNKVVAMIYIDAALRHILDYLDGEECASDSKIPHIGHALACLGILADATETGNLIDNRPKPGVAAELLKRWEEPVAVAAGLSLVAERAKAPVADQVAVDAQIQKVFDGLTKEWDATVFGKKKRTLKRKK